MRSCCFSSCEKGGHRDRAPEQFGVALLARLERLGHVTVEQVAARHTDDARGDVLWDEGDGDTTAVTNDNGSDGDNETTLATVAKSTTVTTSATSTTTTRTTTTKARLRKYATLHACLNMYY